MIGHSWARDLFDRAAERGRLGHAYLLSGPSSVGKTTLALHLARVLVCTGPAPRPCGACRACLHVGRGTHPDVTVIERQDDRRDITIDQVRQLQEGLTLAPYEAQHKLVCLSGVDDLNDAAASALLKTLEEPPPHTTLVLAAADPQSLPSTIRSRCQQITLQPVPVRTIAAGLAAEHQVDPARAQELSLLARGRPGWAVRALATPDLVARERAALESVAGLATSGPFTRLLAVDAWLGKGTFLESRERGLHLLSLLEGWWRDALLAAYAAQTPRLRDHLVGDIAPLACPPADIVAFLARVQETAARLDGNATPRLALETLLAAMPRVPAQTRG
jgi:DNA polymerase-3 subunit delta'